MCMTYCFPENVNYFREYLSTKDMFCKYFRKFLQQRICQDDFRENLWRIFVKLKYFGETSHFPGNGERHFLFSPTSHRFFANKLWNSHKFVNLPSPQKDTKKYNWFYVYDLQKQSTVPLTEGGSTCSLPHWPSYRRRLNLRWGGEGCDARAPTTNNSSHLSPSLL